MRAKRYDGVTAYVGLPGSGKTYSLAKVGVEAMDRGREVWANADGSGEAPWLEGAHVFRSFDEFQTIPNDAVIVWDELPLFVNARKWQEFPDGLLYRLTQIRKDGLELHFSTIDWMMVDTNVRRIAFWVWECEQVIGGLHRRKLFPPKERRQKDERPRRREWFRIKDEITSRYDSWGKVSTGETFRELGAGSKALAPAPSGEERAAGVALPTGAFPSTKRAV